MTNLATRLHAKLTGLRMSLRSRWRVAAALWRLTYPRRGRPHGLDGELIVSFTSYPPRFATLHLTLGCLLDQSVKPDRTILWVAEDDAARLPMGVTRLERRGLEIRTCEDVRSYKKLVPTLRAFPDAFIVTADDDLEFSSDWLETLVKAAAPGERSILCHRAHRPTFDGDGRLSAYLDWEFDVQDDSARAPSTDIMPTTGAGALFPPACLGDLAADSARFERLCPDSDDLWFWWCARIAGTRARKVGGVNLFFLWPGSQEVSLWFANQAGGNDRAIEALSTEFPDALGK